MALSAPLYKKKRVIKVILEAAKGTKLDGTSAVTVFDLDIKDTSPYEKRAATGLYRGNESKGSHGQRSGECSFKFELRGNGATGIDAGQAIILQGCGLKQTAEVYNMHSSHADDKALSIDVWEDGQKKMLTGGMGTIVFEGEVGGSLIGTCVFKGAYTEDTEALPAHAPGTEPALKLKSGSFTLGGESILIGKFSLDMGNVVTLRPDASKASGILSACIPNTDPTVSLDPEQDLIAGYDFNGIKLAGTEAAVSLVVSNGTTTATIALPAVQTTELVPGEREGISTYDFTGQCNHSSGDDAVTITAAAA